MRRYIHTPTSSRASPLMLPMHYLHAFGEELQPQDLCCSERGKKKKKKKNMIPQTSCSPQSPPRRRPQMRPLISTHVARPSCPSVTAALRLNTKGTEKCILDHNVTVIDARLSLVLERDKKADRACPQIDFDFGS